MNKGWTPEPLTISIEEAARWAHVGIDVVTDWVKKDRTFPAFKQGRHTIIPIEPFREWINQRGKMRIGIKTTSSQVAELIDLMRPEGTPSAMRQRARASKKMAKQIEKGIFEERRES